MKSHSLSLYLVLLRKFCKKVRCFLAKFTQLTKFLHGRRSWKISTLAWAPKIGPTFAKKKLDSSSDEPMQCHLNSWMGQVFGFLNTLLRIKNHWRSLQILIERPFAFRGPRLTIHGCRSQNIPPHPHFYYVPIIIPINIILLYIIIIIITPHPHFYYISRTSHQLSIAFPLTAFQHLAI